MCGRFSILDDIEDLCERFGCQPVKVDFEPRYNIAPTQVVPVITRGERGNELQLMRWGLIPNWAKDGKMGSRLINARMETVFEKPAFRDAIRNRRCLVPADGYYEWMKDKGKKLPYRIVLKNREVFAFAGLWDSWLDGEERQLFTFTVLTTEPVGAVTDIHHRMPLILAREQEREWLAGRAGLSRADNREFLEHFSPDPGLEAFRVSTYVNSPKNDSPNCIAEVE